MIPIKQEIDEKIISKKSKVFLSHLNKKYHDFSYFLKCMILRADDWEKISSMDFFKPAKELLRKLNNNPYDFSPIIEIIELINEHKQAQINSKVKKMYGDVITPFSVVNEMLDTLPTYVWGNPYLKWFNPASGIGTFAIIIVQRLMESLKDYEDDELNLINDVDRYNHIVQNMLYMCDNQTSSNCIADQFIPHANIYTKSYLRNGFDWHMENVWKIKKFDIIVNSPPYNSLCHKFSTKSVSLLKENGLLVQVNPATWRKPTSENSQAKEAWNLLTHENRLLYLEIHPLKDGYKNFGEYRRYDFFCMKKTTEHIETQLVDEKGVRYKTDLSHLQFLPNYNIENVEKLLSKQYDDFFEIEENLDNCDRILFSRTAYGQDRPYVSEVKVGRYIYPLVHYIKEDGVVLMYSAVNDRGFFGVPKVIFGEKGLHDVIIDMNGEYGMTSHSFALRVETYEEALRIKEYVLSDEFKEIIASCSWGSYYIALSKPPCFIDWRMFTYFKDKFWI